MVWIYPLASVLVISAVSMVGILTLGLKVEKLKRILNLLVAFSAGALIGDSFLHLLPEAMGEGSSSSVSLIIFAGILFFFVLEKILRWRHCHELNCEDHPKHLGSMNLVGDGIHNFIDGILIGASFLASVPVGLATSLAIILHEIPQELGDFGVLLHSGFSKKRAILFNLFSASLAVFGLLLVLLFGSVMKNFSELMIPFAAGGFLYIALSDLVPELHKEEKGPKSFYQLVFIALGILIMYGLLLVEK